MKNGQHFRAKGQSHIGCSPYRKAGLHQRVGDDLAGGRVEAGHGLLVEYPALRDGRWNLPMSQKAIIPA